MAKKKCPHWSYCLFRRAYGYCILAIEDECNFYTLRKRKGCEDCCLEGTDICDHTNEKGGAE